MVTSRPLGYWRFFGQRFRVAPIHRVLPSGVTIVWDMWFSVTRSWCEDLGDLLSSHFILRACALWCVMQYSVFVACLLNDLFSRHFPHWKEVWNDQLCAFLHQLCDITAVLECLYAGCIRDPPEKVLVWSCEIKSTVNAFWLIVMDLYKCSRETAFNIF